MKSLALIVCLLAPLALADVPPAAPAQVETAPLATRLHALLDEMEKAQRDDVYDAAKLVLAETGDPTAFYALMEEASKAGSAVATVWLAPIEMERVAVRHELTSSWEPQVRDPRAVEMRARVLAAAGKGYRPAYALAANIVGRPFGGDPDEAEAKRLLMEGSKAGCPQARVGYLLLSGRLQKGGTKDPAVAAELKRSNAYLEETLARISGDTAEGVAWLRRATEHGSALAPYVLTQSSAAALPEQEAMEMLKLSAERHYPDALAFLGNIRLHARALSAATGLGIEEDLAGGLVLLKLAAALGHAEAARSLASAMVLEEGGKHAPEIICALYRMAAEHGDPQGMAGYGYCLLAGRGCTQDAARGEELLRRAQGKNAQWVNQALASAYYNGFGVKPDLRRAVNALGEDAAMGSQHAYAIMAALTALGNEGTAPDAFRARIYLDMAKDEDPEAQAVYDAIIAAKGWRFLPGLWN